MNRANHLFVFSFSLLKQIWCQQMNSRLCFWKKSEKKSQNTISGSWSLTGLKGWSRRALAELRLPQATCPDIPTLHPGQKIDSGELSRLLDYILCGQLHWSGLYHPWRSNNTSRYCNWGESNTDKPRPWAVWVSIVSRFHGVLASLGILHAAWVQFPWLR